MVNRNQKKDQRDFLNFLNSKSENYSSEKISQKILTYVRNELNPTHVLVFSKLLGTQALVGFLTLLFCPQFNFSLTNNFNFFHYLYNSFGENVCAAICGSIFIGSGAQLAAYALKEGEIRKIKEFKLIYYFAITSIALMVFAGLRAELHLNLVLFWFVGAIVAGITLFEANRFFRFKVLHY